MKTLKNEFEEYLQCTLQKDIPSKTREAIAKRNQEELKELKSIKQELDNELNKLESIPLYKEYLIKEKKINSILINIREGLNIIFEDILNNKIS